MSRFALQQRNQIVSGSTAAFSTVSTTYVTPTNLTAALELSGLNPVMIGLRPAETTVDANASDLYIDRNGGATGVIIGRVAFRMGIGALGASDRQHQFFLRAEANTQQEEIGWPVGSFTTLINEFVGSPGTYNFDCQVRIDSGTPRTMHVKSIKMWVLEL